jgi:hypothetical protein
MTAHDIAGLCERLRKLTRSFKQYMGASSVEDMVKAANTLERQAAEIERLRESVDLLGSVPILIIDRNAAHATDDKAAVEYADAMLPWAKRAKAFLARAALTGEDHDHA